MMKRFLSIVAIALLAFPSMLKAQDKATAGLQVAGIAFYNLENLFDTIPNNPEGRDEEFTPKGSRQWNGDKYWKKIQQSGARYF